MVVLSSALRWQPRFGFFSIRCWAISVFLCIALRGGLDCLVWGCATRVAAVIFGVLFADCFLVLPRGSFGFKGLAQYVELVVYVAVGLGVAAIGGVMRASVGAMLEGPGSDGRSRAKRGTLTPHAAFLRNRRMELGYRAEYHRGR